MARRSLKSDESFLMKLAAGAAGALRVREDLRGQGHDPVPLDRGSTNFKIWKTIKIKRIRVPDILCVRCGVCVEARAKSSVELSMSHAVSDPARSWDEGLSDTDLIAVVGCGRVGGPTDWKARDVVQYAEVGRLREAFTKGGAILAGRKGVQEGSEERIVWLTRVARYEGTVVSITSDRLQYRRKDGRLISLRLPAHGIGLKPLVVVGEQVVPDQIVASVVEVSRRAPLCRDAVGTDAYLGTLASKSLSERFAAVRALSTMRSESVVSALTSLLSDAKEDILVQLEAAAGLARWGIMDGWEFIRQCLHHRYPAYRLESVIVLAEIQGNASCDTLCEVLNDTQQVAEVRAGAAWALGEIKSGRAINALIGSFESVDQGIRIEAARALAQLAPFYASELETLLVEATPSLRPGIAWALGKRGQLNLGSVLKKPIDDDARRWLAYVLGVQDPHRYAEEIEGLKTQDPEVYFAATVLWNIVTSWVYRLEEY